MIPHWGVQLAFLEHSTHIHNSSCSGALFSWDNTPTVTCSRDNKVSPLCPLGNEQEAVDEMLWMVVQSRTGVVRLCKLWPGKWSGERTVRRGSARGSPAPARLLRACVRVLCNRVARELPNWVCGYNPVPRSFGKVVLKLGENLYHPDERNTRLFALKVCCWVILYGGIPKCTRVCL